MTRPKPQRATRGDTNRPDAVQLRARRSPKLIAAGAVFVVIGALGAAALYSSSNNAQAAVGVSRAIPRGTQLTEADLTIVQVPEGFPVAVHPADDIDALLGQTALTDLPEGSFPVAAHVGDDPLPDGEALVGLRLTHGQLPASPMPRGTVVQLVDLTDRSTETDPTSDDAADPAPAPESSGGVAESLRAVVSVAPLMLDDGSFSLDVRVDAAHADHVARLAAANLLAVVVVKEP